jgi:hypothetical protein
LSFPYIHLADATISLYLTGEVIARRALIGRSSKRNGKASAYFHFLFWEDSGNDASITITVLLSFMMEASGISTKIKMKMYSYWNLMASQFSGISFTGVT